MKFSIIIPIYNTPELFFRECVDSALGQLYPDVEIILVDDGSTDETTLTLLDEYSKHYENLLLLKKTNGGQGSARNCGMDNASGDYVLFMDSDDYYLSSAVIADHARLLTESNADVCSFQYAEFFNENQRPVFADGDLPRNKIFKQKVSTAINVLLRSSKSVFSSVTHTKAIKLDFLRKHHIRFPENTNCEDVFFTAQLVRYAKSYDRYNKIAYAFRRTNLNSDTAQGKKTLKIERDMIFIFDQMFSFPDTRKNTILLNYLSSPYVYWMGKIVNALFLYKDLETRQEILHDIDKMKRYAFVLNYSSRPYIYFIGVLQKLFGMKCVLHMLKLYLLLNRKHVLSVKRKTN